MAAPYCKFFGRKSLHISILKFESFFKNYSVLGQFESIHKDFGKLVTKRHIESEFAIRYPFHFSRRIVDSFSGNHVIKLDNLS